MEIITGYAGRGHVTSAQTGATNAGILGDGQYILNVGGKMAATKVDNNHVSIANGYGIDQGRFFVTTGETVTIETGSAGSKREDLIVARYEKTNAGVETSILKVIKGTAGDEYATPSYVQGDILAGDSVDEMVLYKVHLDSNEIDEIIAVASTASVMTEKVDKVSGKGLSTNDYTTAEKEKLAGVEAGATNTTVENSLTSDSTTNALSAAQGKALNNSFTNLESTVNNLNSRPSKIKEVTVGNSTTISNWSNYAKKNIQFVLYSGATHCASVPYTSDDMRLNYNDGTNRVVKVVTSVSNNIATFTVTNISNASGWGIAIFVSN